MLNFRGLTALSISLAATTAAQADSRGDWQGGYGQMFWGGGYGMFGGLMMLVFWGVVIALIVLAVRWFSQDRNDTGPKADAMDILRERFARGEIDEEEFERRRKTLES